MKASKAYYLEIKLIICLVHVKILSGLLLRLFVVVKLVPAPGESRDLPKISVFEKTDCKGVVNLYELISILYKGGGNKILNDGKYGKDINLIKYEEVRQKISKITREDNMDLSLNALQVGGGGSFVKPLLKDDDNLVTLDIDEKFAEPGVVIGDICNCPQLPDESFDIVCCTAVLEHVFEPWDAIKEMTRILKTGGYLYITSPFSWRFHPCPIDFYRFTPQALEYLVSKYAKNRTLLSGFNIEYRRKSSTGGPPGDPGIPPLDYLGGWLEQWDSLYLCQKL